MHVFKRIGLIAVALAAPLTRSAAAGEPGAAEILKMADHANTNFSDFSVETRMEIFEPGAATGREAKMVSYTKGEKRMVRFIAPADSKGMGMLVENKDTMYVYLPGFQKVRRMGTHAKNQSFMGSDVSNEDMAEQTYSQSYGAKIVGTEGGDWMLQLDVLPGKDQEFPRLKMWVSKEMKAITRIDYFDEKGTMAKSQTRTHFKLDPGSTDHYTPAEITFIDHRRNDHKTVMHLSNAQVNQHLGDDMFSQRALLRGQ